MRVEGETVSSARHAARTDSLQMEHVRVAGRVDWPGVALYCAIASAISMPLLLWRDLSPQTWLTSPIPGWLRPLLYGWGPGIAALVLLPLRRAQHPRTVTFFGTSVARSVMLVLIPILTVALLAPARSVAHPHLWGLVAGMHAVAYALGEELGWRGYLHDALRPLGARLQSIVLGLIWGVWHVLTFAGHGSVTSIALRLLVFYAVLMLASAAIGAAADRSHSVLVATACHLFYTLSGMLAGTDRWIALGVLGAAVFGVVHFWPSTVTTPAVAGTRT